MPTIEQRQSSDAFPALSPAQCWTAPASIPRDVAKKILAARDAILSGNNYEVYHQIYSIADPTFLNNEPWKILEQSNDQAHARPEQQKP